MAVGAGVCSGGGSPPDAVKTYSDRLELVTTAWPPGGDDSVNAIATHREFNWFSKWKFRCGQPTRQFFHGVQLCRLVDLGETGGAHGGADIFRTIQRWRLCSSARWIPCCRISRPTPMDDRPVPRVWLYMGICSRTIISGKYLYRPPAGGHVGAGADVDAAGGHVGRGGRRAERALQDRGRGDGWRSTCCRLRVVSALPLGVAAHRAARRCVHHEFHGARLAGLGKSRNKRAASRACSALTSRHRRP